MSWTDRQIDDACDTLKKMIRAADASNHLGELSVMRAVAASKLARALDAILPYCTDAPDDIRHQAAAALALSRGEPEPTAPPMRRVNLEIEAHA